jgi:hypothetical protein
MLIFSLLFRNAFSRNYSARYLLLFAPHLAASMQSVHWRYTVHLGVRRFSHFLFLADWFGTHMLFEFYFARQYLDFWELAICSEYFWSLFARLLIIPYRPYSSALGSAIYIIHTGTWVCASGSVDGGEDHSVTLSSAAWGLMPMPSSSRLKRVCSARRLASMYIMNSW